MKASELKKLIGKKVKFTSNRTMVYFESIWVGTIEDVSSREVLCRGDWHENKTFNVIEVIS